LSASPKALSAFTKSYVDPVTKKFTIDANYKTTSTILAYDTYDKPKLSQGRDRQKTATVWAYGASVPVLQVQNADLETFAFSDFETKTAVAFDTTCLSCDPFSKLMVRSDNSGLWAMDPVETTLSKTLTKGTGDYRLAGWWNRASTTLRGYVTIKSVDKATTYYNQTFDITASATSGYQYFEKIIPMSNIPSQFYIEIYFWPLSTVTRTSEVDNVWLGPLQASYTYTTYTFPYGAQSTGSHQTLQSIVYDGLGRIKYVRDKDKNIVQRKVYQFNNN
jgi:hypothetical protein